MEEIFPGNICADVTAVPLIDLNRVLTILSRLTRSLSIQSNGNSKARAETQFNRLAIPRFHCGLAPRLFDELALLPKLRKSLSGFPARLAISVLNLFLLIVIRMNTGGWCFSRILNEFPMKKGNCVHAFSPCVLSTTSFL